MKKHLVLLAIAALPIFFSQKAEASCTQTQSCWFNGCFTQLTIDSDFENNCSNGWVKLNGAHRIYGNQCSYSYNSWMMAMDTIGGYSTKAAIYQDVAIPATGGRSLSLDIAPLAVSGIPPSGWLTVTFRNPSTNQVLETVANIPLDPNSYFCQALGYTPHGNYFGQTVRVYVEATLFNSGSAFDLDWVRLWLNP